ncbi:uncharacterized protein CCOS01_09911 [Colletotrichum costaricense]|uniref:Uncharacterized protein n=1 Tax=Colletotrichum costaricense TaxID=1209916 RepID=A0AAI9YSD1_9PEZI|nr:uncharacterized protein CCOS01_09911 [Colletotrichum costaricense]KAK1522199.1 hypothetical protein CCOS01_09911 [Colletotrichum costaricense]
MSELRSDEPWTAPSLQPIDFINDCITLSDGTITSPQTSPSLGPFHTYANHRAFYRFGLIEPNGSFDEECAVELRSHLNFEMDDDIVGIGVGRSFHSQRHRVIPSFCTLGLT